MKFRFASFCIIAVIGLAGPLAWASSDAGEETDASDSIGSEKIPRLGRNSVNIDSTAFFREALQHEDKEFPGLVYIGARVLGMDPGFVYSCREGLELLYLREYTSAKAHFDQMGRDWPGTAVSPIGQVLVWQALMLENFDFKFEQQYQHSSKKARQQLQEALLQPGNEGWEHFVMGGMLGIESIHAVRHEEYLSALNRGYEAMKSIKKAQEAAPEFVDATLGDGLYNYWVTIISMSSKLIPTRTDRRLEGIEQMMLVEQQGIFLGPAATLGLTFTWIEEKRTGEALRSALKNHRNYPNNVINNIVLSRIYIYKRKYTDAERLLKNILKTAPKNERAHYYLGRLYLRWNKIDLAEKHLDTYLAFSDLDEMYRGWALYYRGHLYYRKKQWDEAEDCYKQAWKKAKVKKAKSRLAKIDEQRKKSRTE